MRPRVADKSASRLLGSHGDGRAEGDSSVALALDTSDATLGEAPLSCGQFFLFCLLGNLTLASWNFFLTAIGFFELWFPDREWAFISSMTFQGASLFGNFAMVAVGTLVPFRTGYSVSIILKIVPLIVAPMLAFWSGTVTDGVINGSVWGFSSTVVLVALLGLAESVFSSLVISLASTLGPHHVGAVMAGQGIIGIVAPILMFGLMLGAGDATKYPYSVVFGFFGFCAALQVSGLAVLPGIPTIRRRPVSHSLRPLTNVLREAAPQITNVFATFMITFIVFPGVAASWTPQLHFFIQRGPLGKHWYTMSVVGIFQLFDVVGRMSPSIVKRLGASRKRLWMFVAIRLVFVPSFILFQRDKALLAAPWQSYIELLAMGLFALTNGWCGTLAMIYGPQQVVGEEQRVGAAMNLALIGGIFVGSLLALLTQIGV